MQSGGTQRFAVVRLRKRSEWVLPKGKLDDGETARQAAEREVLEETGHAVMVHEFLGTLAYASATGPKVVHFWRMEAELAPSHALMNDVKAVDWLPLEAALERLSRSHERAFLAEVGPLALDAAIGTSDIGPSLRSRPEVVEGSHAKHAPDPERAAPSRTLLSRLWRRLRGG